MANKKFKIRTGDLVKVIAGNDNGKTGKVVRVIPEKERVVVEGVSIVSKHKKPSATNPNGGIEKVEAPIHISNVALVNDKGETTKVGRKLNSDGKLQRYSKSTGEFI